MSTMTYTGTLVVTRCWCGIHLAIPQDLYDVAQRVKGTRDEKTIWCPLGHEFVYTGETEAAKEKRLRRYAEDRAASERARADQIEASLRATKGVVTKMRKRAIAGACQFCNRHFVNVERHVKACHPKEVADVPEATV